MNNKKEDVILSGKNKDAVALGRLGGLARAAALTPERRREIASYAARKRWEKRQLHLHGKEQN